MCTDDLRLAVRDGALLRGSATPTTVRADPTMRDGPLFRGLATPELTVGRVVIPTLARFDYNLFAPESRTAFLSARQRMFAQGLYPGVDYLVEERSAGGALSVRPTYPLRKKLEREWPIVVEPELAPRWLTPSDYNLLTAAFALGLAGGGLAAAACLTACFTLSVVTSESMVPTLLPRDVVLVEKVTAVAAPRPASPVLRPPEPLRAIVRERGGAVADGTLFVKRVAGTAGARVAVQRTARRRSTPPRCEARWAARSRRSSARASTPSATSSSPRRQPRRVDRLALLGRAARARSPKAAVARAPAVEVGRVEARSE